LRDAVAMQNRRGSRQSLVPPIRSDRIPAVAAGQKEEARQALGCPAADFGEEFTDFNRL
jgi:hypothetical protein